MPRELEFMKSRDEKGMPDDEFKTIREQYNQRAEESAELVKKVIFGVMGVLFVSFAGINLLSFFQEFKYGNYIWLIVEFIILSLLLYDPKIEEDKRYKYETDQKIILKSLENKVKLNRVRFIAVIILGVIFAVINIFCWWFVIDIMYSGMV